MSDPSHVYVWMGPVSGTEDSSGRPKIVIQIKRGRHTIVRIEMDPAEFALCLSGRLVPGTITKGGE